ncbi:hypothetical protein JQU41_05135 [Ponticoccus sp. SC6-36]|nr:hypothetical protein [Ponticoccus sp. SC6-36]
MFFTSFDDLTGELLLRTGATIVLSALWTDEFDVIDLAGKLSLMGFTGRYRAVSSGVPRPGLIVSDVRRVYPFLDFRILLFSGKGRQTTWVEYDDQV